jgi:hypothetical protein
MAWQLQHLEALAGQPQADPAQTEALALAVSAFVAGAPSDFLEPLLASPFGRVYRLFLERCCRQPLGAGTQPQRDSLSQRLRQVGFEQPEGQALLLALMPFYPPGQLRVEDAAAKLPGWLLELYRQRYEAAPAPSPAQAAGAPVPSGDPSFNDRIFLNRMLGLSNLYYIDPEDQEILQELRQVRLQTVQLLLSVDREQLGRQFTADFGDRYWAMAQSGVQKEPLDANEASQRDALQQWLTSHANSLAIEGGIQRFAGALLFAMPGSVQLANPEQNLPAWFLEGFRRYSSIAAAV